MVEVAQLGSALGFAWAVILTVCTILNVLAAVVLARASLPRRLEARLQSVLIELDVYAKALQEFERQDDQRQATLRTLVDEAEGAFDRVERKRASAAATISRREQGAPAAPRSRAELIAMMRSKGAAAGAAVLCVLLFGCASMIDSTPRAVREAVCTAVEAGLCPDDEEGK